MNSSIKFSYVLTTFNKLQYLRITLPRLIEACKHDEEIIVVDGGSSDGTRDYLQILFDEGKIHQFKSEKDCGEAHGTNKALLMARGDLIKIITDDDLFHFGHISRCRSFMEQQPSVDLVATDGYYHNLAVSGKAIRTSAIKEFQDWLVTHKPFFFTGLGLMIRRNSLPIIGLFDSSFLVVDYEFSLRVTAGKSKLAWYTGPLFYNIVTENSNSYRHWERLYLERRKLTRYFGISNNVWSDKLVVLRSKLSIAFKDAPKKTVFFSYSDVVNRAEVLLNTTANGAQFYS